MPFLSSTLGVDYAGRVSVPRLSASNFRHYVSAASPFFNPFVKFVCKLVRVFNACECLDDNLSIPSDILNQHFNHSRPTFPGVNPCFDDTIVTKKLQNYNIKIA